MFEQNNIAKKARKIVVDVLKSEGWRVRNRADGQSIYTTPGGRTSTLCLLQYEGGRFWRWHIDCLMVRIPGKLEMARPCPPTGMEGHGELTMFEDELTALAEWLARWMIAAEAGKELPACPVALDMGHAGVGNNVWTIRARTEYSRPVR